MNDHPYMPLYFGDLLKQTLYWSGEERALLILLTAAQWWNGALPLDLSKLAAAIQYDEKRFLALWNERLHALFVETPHGYVHEDTEDRRRAVSRMSGARRAAGKASGKARRARANTPGKATPMPEQPVADWLEQNSEQHVRTKLQTPDVDNVRTPIQSNPNQSKPDPEPPPSAPRNPGADNTSPSLPSVAPSSPAATAKTGENGARRAPPGRRRMPADHPTEPLRAWAAENTPRVNFDAEIAVLRDYEFRSAHSDWNAVIRNWLRHAEKQTRNRSDDHLTRFERHKRRLYGDA